MTILIAVTAIGGILGSLGGLGVFLSWWNNRKVGDRPTFVTEAHELSAMQTQVIADLRKQRDDDRADFDRRLTLVETRLDHCEEEKATMREDNRVLVLKIQDLVHQLETGR